MIGYLRGRILRKSLRDLLIDAGGIGYRVAVPEHTRLDSAEGAEIEMYTHLAVREDSLALYGFEAESELNLFETLLGVSGIGPKSALAIISGTDADAMRQAIALGDTAYLTKISGIGRKIAEKIVLELKDKMADAGVTGSSYAGTAEREALEALESLGYAIRDVREIVRSLAREHDDPKAIIGKALQALGKRSA